MKRINIVPMTLIAVLMILAVSCTPVQYGQGGYEEAPGTSRRVYRSAPLGSQEVIVVERDPYTGQYYQVSPYGYYGGSPFYGGAWGYNNGYGYGYPGGVVRGGSNRGGNVGTSRPAPRPSAPARPSSPTTQKAKDAIRGN